MALQLMMTPHESDFNRHTPQIVCSAERTHEAPEKRSRNPSRGPSIRTLEEAIQSLRSLSREAQALREGLGRLSEEEAFGHPSARRHLRLGQSALEHAAAVFELLASLLESD